MTMHGKWFGREVKEMTREGAEEALFRGSEYILAKANETVPIEEGILKGSGATDINGNDLVGSVFYNTPYAAEQHENTSIPHDQGKRAKWLELTMQEEARPTADIMATSMKDNWHR